ncbi:hypothetical protein EVAR_89256_1 [Eumeta japonica]|uniref:Uncharacterized protein n=1 Tax=Eumeta variegata TaxID=151549 RepID=A0A4C1VMB9_EUMVA|nr:hypothetical protein EVAR_89256_1 [Eumeta japonica]
MSKKKSKLNFLPVLLETGASSYKLMTSKDSNTRQQCILRKRPLFGLQLLQSQALHVKGGHKGCDTQTPSLSPVSRRQLADPGWGDVRVRRHIDLLAFGSDVLCSHADE